MDNLYDVDNLNKADSVENDSNLNLNIYNINNNQLNIINNVFKDKEIREYKKMESNTQISNKKEINYSNNGPKFISDSNLKNRRLNDDQSFKSNDESESKILSLRRNSLSCVNSLNENSLSKKQKNNYNNHKINISSENVKENNRTVNQNETKVLLNDYLHQRQQNKKMDIINNFSHLKNNPNITNRFRINSPPKRKTPTDDDLINDVLYYETKSLYIFSKKNKFRLFFFRIVENFYFDLFIISIIIINSIILSIALSFNLTTNRFDIFDACEMIFLFIYTAESFIKIVSYGFYSNSAKKCYLNDPWNKLDFLVVIVGLIALFPGVKKFKELTIFRTFRPLRSISLIPGVKELTKTLANSLKDLGNLFLFLVFFLLLYGVFGVSLWSGLFSYRCRETPYPNNGSWDITNNSYSICGGYYKCSVNKTCGSIIDAYDNGNYFLHYKNLYEEQDTEYLNYGLTNFDNMGSALFTIFMCVTLEGWANIMYTFQNGYNYYSSSLFFISLVVIINYFVLNFTIAIMINSCQFSNTLNKEVESKNSSEITNKRMKDDVIEIDLLNRFKYIYSILKEVKIIKKVERYIEFHKKWNICYYCYVIINQPIFDFIIYCTIIFNMGVLASIDDKKLLSVSYNPTEISIFSFSNYFLIGIFTIECILKMLGLGLERYYKNINNIIDQIILLVSIIELSFSKKSIFAILRVLRMFRLLNLLKKWKTLAIIIKCINKTLKEIGNFALLIFIFISVFALAGMNFFKGTVRFDPSNNKYSSLGILPKVNFENIYEAFNAVFVLMIGDNWFEVIFYFLRSPLTNKIYVYCYFIVVTLILNIVILNLVVAFLVNTFNVSRKRFEFIEDAKEINIYLRKHKIKTSLSFSYLSVLKIREKFPLLNKPDLDEFDIFYKKDKRIIGPSASSSSVINDLSKLRLNSVKEERDLNTDKLIKLGRILNSDNRLNISKKVSGKKNTSLSIIHEKNNSKTDNVNFEFEIESDESHIKKKYYSKEIKRENVINYIEETANEDRRKSCVPIVQSKLRNQILTEIISDDDLNYSKKEYYDENNYITPRKVIPKYNSAFNPPYGLSSSDNKIPKDKLRLENLSKLKYFLDVNKLNELEIRNGIYEFENNEEKNEIKNNMRRKSILRSISHNNVDKEKEKFVHNKIEIDKVQAKSCPAKSNLRRLTTHIPINKSKKLNITISSEKRLNVFLKFISSSSLMILHRDWRLRKMLVKLINNSYFELTIIILIVISNIVILLDNQFVDHNSIYYSVLEILDDIFTFAFFIEMMIKILAFGLFFDRESKLEEVFDTDTKHDEKKHEKMLQKFNTQKSLPSSVELIPERKNSARKVLMKFNDLLNENKRKYLDEGMDSKKVSIPSYGTNKLSNNKNHTNNQAITKISSTNSDFGIAQENHENINDHIKSTQLKETSLPEKDTSMPKSYWKRAYLREFFNVLDCFVIILSVIYVVNFRFNRDTQKTEFVKSIKTLRTLRALRPLRLINKFSELKIVVRCLIDSIPAIINMIIIGSFVFFVYAIIGLNLFHGVLGVCSDPKFINSLDCSNNKNTWTKSPKTFDSISASLLTVFEMSTTSDWFNVMYDTVKNTNSWASLYFLSFMLIGSLFIMKLSVTVIVDNFITINELEEGVSIITEDQKEWVNSMKYFLRYKPVPNLNIKKFSIIRLLCYNIINWRHFNNMINIMIFINVVCMFTRYDRSGILVEDIQSYVFYFFTFVFTIEIIIKLVAYRKMYFIDVWNKFDFIVMIISSFSVLLNIIQFYLKSNKIIFGKFNIIPVLIRGTRILRVFRLMNLNTSVKNYFNTLIFLFPSLINLGSLVLIILTTYSIIGMNLFGTVMYGRAINNNNNMQNFLSSFIFLIRTTTGDDWNQSMHELALNQPGCIDDQTYEQLINDGPKGCGSYYAFHFFISFVMMNSLIIMNLFIAVVVESFKINTQKVESINDNEMKHFFEIWGKYDTFITYYLEIHEFVLLMMELPTPLGINGDKMFINYTNLKEFKGNIYVSYNNKYFVDDLHCMKILTLLNLKTKNNKVHIIDAIKLVTKRAVIFRCDMLETEGIEHYEEKINELSIDHSRFNKKLNENFTSYNSDYSNGIKCENKADFVVASRIILKFLSKWRKNRKKSKEIKKITEKEMVQIHIY